MKKHEIDAERNTLNRDLLHSGKYRAQTHKSAKQYRRNEKHKGRSFKSDYGLSFAHYRILLTKFNPLFRPAFTRLLYRMRYRPMTVAQNSQAI